MKKHRNKVGKTWRILLPALLFLCLWGCGLKKTSREKLRDIEFTVTEESQIPEELLASMEEKKAEGYKLTYSDKENLYIAVGYGAQKTGGYSVSVDNCYLAKNAVYFATTLTGPAKGEKVNQVTSYPGIVVKMEFLDKSVVFE